jgi:hypothetical protein
MLIKPLIKGLFSFSLNCHNIFLFLLLLNELPTCQAFNEENNYCPSKYILWDFKNL